MICSGIIAASMIVCAQPRVDFQTFYAKVCMHGVTLPPSQWSGFRGETYDAIQRRIFDAQALYIDYAEKYRDRCRATE